MSTLVMELESASRTAATPPASLATEPESAGPAGSRLVACLRHGAAIGVRLVVLTPTDARVFGPSLERFPERSIHPAAHAQWETAHRLFLGRSRQPLDRGSWLVLAVNRDDRVVGAISARFFCGEIAAEYIHALSLASTCGPMFREHCELAVAEAFATAALSGRMPAEISHWTAAPGRQAAFLRVLLVRAMAALASAFDLPLCVLAADHRRGEVARLMRRGAAPLGRAGKFALPPFVDHKGGAWLRLLLLDTAAFHARSRTNPAVELAALREHASLISAG